MNEDFHIQVIRVISLSSAKIFCHRNIGKDNLSCIFLDKSLLKGPEMTRKLKVSTMDPSVDCHFFKLKENFCFGLY